MIKYIIETRTSQRDVNGNCYHFSIIISTMTGKRLYVNSGGQSNAVIELLQLTKLSYNDVYIVNVMLPKKQWKHEWQMNYTGYQWFTMDDIKALDTI